MGYSRHKGKGQSDSASRKSKSSSSSKSSGSSSGSNSWASSSTARFVGKVQAAQKKAATQKATSGRKSRSGGGGTSRSFADTQTGKFVGRVQAAQEAAATQKATTGKKSGGGRRPPRDGAMDLTEKFVARQQAAQMVAASRDQAAFTGAPSRRGASIHAEMIDPHIHAEHTPSIPMKHVQPGMEGQTSYEQAMQRLGRGGEKEAAKYSKTRSEYERAVSGEDRLSTGEIKRLGHRMEKEYAEYEVARGEPIQTGMTSGDRKKTWAYKSHEVAEAVRGFEMFPTGGFRAQDATSGTRTEATLDDMFGVSAPEARGKKTLADYLKEGVAQNIEMFGSAPTTLRHGAKLAAEDPGMVPALGVAAVGGMVKGAKEDPLQTVVTMGLTAGISKGVAKAGGAAIRAQPIKTVSMKHGMAHVATKGGLHGYIKPMTGEIAIKAHGTAHRLKATGAKPKRAPVPDRSVTDSITREQTRVATVESLTQDVIGAKPAKGHVELGFGAREQIVKTALGEIKPPKPAKGRVDLGLSAREQVVGSLVELGKEAKPTKGRVDLGFTTRQQVIKSLADIGKESKTVRGRSEFGYTPRQTLVRMLGEGVKEPTKVKGSMYELGIGAREQLSAGADLSTYAVGAPITMRGGAAQSLASIAMFTGEMVRTGSRTKSVYKQMPGQTYFSPAEAMSMYATPKATIAAAPKIAHAAPARAMSMPGVNVLALATPVSTLTRGRQLERMYEPLGMQMPDLVISKERTGVKEKVKEREKQEIVMPMGVKEMLRVGEMVDVGVRIKEMTLQKPKTLQKERQKTAVVVTQKGGMYPDTPLPVLPPVVAIPVVFGAEKRRKQLRPKKKTKRGVSFEEITNPIKAIEDFL